MPEAPDGNTGFELRGVLPAGQTDLRIEAQTPDGNWHVFFTHTVEVRRQWLPLWLGGGGWTELLFRQMPHHMQHLPRTLQPERFPAPSIMPARTLRLSIVTPALQQSCFLPETLNSVIDQQKSDCEYVVQDGGSTDGSMEIIQRHAARLHAWESVPDHGQADAIMRGFARTSGRPEDLMAWINSDDFYLPGALAFVVDYFARHPEVDVLYGHRILVDEQSREIGRWFLPKHDDQVLRLYDFVPQENMFWRRRIWDKVGGLNPSFKFAMDWDLLLRFQATGAKIVRVPYFLACFRLHSRQKTAAAMHDVGQQEITLLRERTHGRPHTPQELENNPRLIRYLRRSAFFRFMWNLGIRLM